MERLISYVMKEKCRSSCNLQSWILCEISLLLVEQMGIPAALTCSSLLPSFFLISC